MELIKQTAYRDGQMTVSIVESEHGVRYEVRDYAATPVFPVARSYFRHDRRRACLVRISERSGVKVRARLDSVVSRPYGA